MKKRMGFCILAVVCMMLLLSGIVFAANSGSCGENTTWKLEDGILTISGTGEMTDAPWLAQKDQIAEVIIDEGVTSVCDGAFDGCAKLEYVTVPASVKNLGDRAFANCSKLRMMFFYGDKPEFRTSCFANTSTTVFHPAGNATWPSGVIASKIYCQPTDYATSGTWGDNIQWKYENGVLTFSGTGEMLQPDSSTFVPWVIFETKAHKVVVGDGITKLNNNFVQRFKKLTTVSLPEGLTEISGRAFSMCTNLQTVNIPSTVTVIKDFGFDTCKSLKQIHLPSGLREIKSDAFRHCTALQSITFPSGVTRIFDTSFAYCTSLKNIFFMGDVPQWILDSAFQDVTATAYYPAGNATWTEDKLQNYGGTLTWEPFCGDEHTVETIAGVAPGCATTGLTEGKRCKYCGEVLQAQEEIPATGHSFGDWQEVEAATAEQTGLAERECATCGAVEQKTLDKLAPDEPEPTETEPEPTETEPEPTETEPEPTETEPEQVPSEPTEAETEPSGEETQATDPADPTQPDIAVEEELKETPWALIIIGAVAVIAAGAGGIYFFRKRK